MISPETQRGLMDEPEGQKDILEAECSILRALCQGTPQGSVWNEGIRMLEDYRFQSHDHQLVFDALREIGTDAPQIIREQLAARLTRKGFPDLDLEIYFQPHHLTAAQVVSLMRSVHAAGRKKEHRDAAVG